MNSLIRDVVEVLRERADKAGVTLSFEPEEPQRAEVDQREIFRVLLNLLINALEACKEGGEVRVDCKADESGCTIHISDNGCGIPEELMPKLSQAFVSTKGSAGTGLGLACSYKIIREHGGTIQVESKMGEGTTFTIFLPHVPSIPRPTVPMNQPVDV